MTGVLFATLIHDGTIANGWDATLRELLPAAEGTAYEDLTVRELLGHRSGIPRDDLSGWLTGTRSFTRTISECKGEAVHKMR